MKDLNYVIGRLQGLNELVKILKDLVDKKGPEGSEIVAVITDHISDQLDSILSEFDSIEVQPEHKEVLAQIKEKHEELKKEIIPEPESKDEPKTEPSGEPVSAESENREKLEKHEKSVDDLLKDLEKLKTS